MSRLNVANNAQTLLDGAISDAADTMTVLDGSIFPSVPFLVTIDQEIIQVRSKAGNVFSSLLRGQEGTVAAGHDDGAIIENRFTKGNYDSLALQEDLNNHLADGTQYTATLQNGFTGTISYQKNGHNQVWLKIYIANVPSTAAGTVICNIPEGYRPATFVNPVVRVANISPYGNLSPFCLYTDGNLCLGGNNGLVVTSNANINGGVLYYANL